jgi:hypothetical protein
MIEFLTSTNDSGKTIQILNIGNQTFTVPGSNKIVLSFVGTINHLIASLNLNNSQITAFNNKEVVQISCSNLTSGSFQTLPDDFFRVQIDEKTQDDFILIASNISILSIYSYVQNMIHEKIIHTERINSYLEKEKLHALLIHLTALEILGQNPPISMEDAVVARLNYLKTV